MYLADLLSRPQSLKEIAKTGRVERNARQIMGTLEDELLKEVINTGEKDEQYTLVRKFIEEVKVKMEKKTKKNVELA